MGAGAGLIAPVSRRTALPAALLLLVLFAGSGNAGTASACLDTARLVPASARARALAAAALREQQAFGGQAMDAEGRLVQAGNYEAEDVRESPLGKAPWQRVLAYWRAVEGPGAGRLPDAVAFGALRPARRGLLEQALNQASSDYLQGLGTGPGQGLDSSERRAMQVALRRVAVIDTPWSAAFISWLARQAGLEEGEFVFSDAHADYAGAAFRAGADEAAGRPDGFAFRACDPMQTPPRIGDLLCQTRESAADITGFGPLGRALAARPTGGRAFPMHCDAVVAVDAAGFDAVGGNLLQSVTARRFDFAAGTALLDSSYLEGACAPGAAGCIDRHMSRQPWVLLMQWREGAPDQPRALSEPAPAPAP